MTFSFRSRALAAPLAATLALAACHPSGQQGASANDAAPALPPLAGNAAVADTAASSARAPALGALPAARPLAYAYEDAPGPGGYGWIDQADLLLDTIGDAPPDYAFGYDGVEPWAWETADRYDIYAEPIDDGWRYYYYAPGAGEPFLVRDPAYSYGYRNGRVAAIYGADGRYLDRAAALRQAEAAARYFARAGALRAAARTNPRLAVAATRWASQRQAVAAARRQWDEARAHQEDWQRQRAARQADIARREAERTARAAAAARFIAWQQAQFRGPAPRLYGGRPGQPEAQILARREAAARQQELRRQPPPQAEAGRRAAAMGRAQAQAGEVQAQQAQSAARAAEARQRAGAARAEAAVRQHQHAEVQAHAQHLPMQRELQARPQALRVRPQVQPQAVHVRQRAMPMPQRPPIQPAIQARHAAHAPPVARAPGPIRVRQAPQAQVRTPAAAAAAPAHRRPDPQGHGHEH